MKTSISTQYSYKKLSNAALACLAILASQAATATPVQWKKADGGNDHWYEVVAGSLTWDQANAKAKTAFNGKGYLATVTSQAENNFIRDLIPSVINPWLGGFQNHEAADYSEPAGGWEWITGEPFSYTNWGSGEPNNAGGEDNLHMIYSRGDWNDLKNSNIAQSKGYVVEAPPQILAKPNVLSVAPTAIRLTWSDASPGTKGFRIQRKPGLCDSTNAWAILSDVRGNTETLLDTPLLASSPYSYGVAIYYGGGSFSDYSPCASVTTSAAGTPNMPLKLIAVSRSDSRIDLAWEDNSGNETGFEIRRRVDAGNWELLKTVSAGKQAYRDSTADGNGSTAMYRYDVRACNALGCSMPNLAVIVPFRPVNLEATVDTRIKLAWEDKSSNETVFRIERKNGVCTADTPWVFLRRLVPDTQNYTDNGAVPGTTYSYRVQAVYVTAAVPKSRGYSGFSDCVTATMP